jgi:hypothetical protein
MLPYYEGNRCYLVADPHVHHTWLKLHLKCHNWGEKGHIRAHCPKYIEQLKLGKIKLPTKQHLGPCGPPVAHPPDRPTPC